MSPCGIVRDGGSYRNGNPVPATDPKFNSNPVHWVPSPEHFGNPVDWTPSPEHFGAVVTWQPNPDYFGNLIGANDVVFTPSGGTYTSTQSVALTSAGAQSIIYTTDGSTPSLTHGTTYTGPIGVSISETIKAIAVRAVTETSPVGSAAYVINLATTFPIMWFAIGSFIQAGVYGSTPLVPFSLGQTVQFSGFTGAGSVLNGAQTTITFIDQNPGDLGGPFFVGNNPSLPSSSGNDNGLATLV